MGQAKQRGTREKRVKEGIAKRKAREEVEQAAEDEKARQREEAFNEKQAKRIEERKEENKLKERSGKYSRNPSSYRSFSSRNVMLAALTIAATSGIKP